MNEVTQLRFERDQALRWFQDSERRRKEMVDAFRILLQESGALRDVEERLDQLETDGDHS
jgi:hypothetical protein